MKVCVIGTGYVGLVTGACLADFGNEVICIDNDPEKLNLLKNGKIPIYEPGLEELVQKNTKAGHLRFSGDIAEGVEKSSVIFISVSTPSKTDGSADLSYVEKVARDVAQHMKEYKVIVEKSTVPVMTGKKVAETISRYCPKEVPFDVVSNPEFLREGSAIADTLYPDRIVIGVASQKAADILKELYSPIKAPLIITDIKSAEIIKHASNSFLAMKISFINAVARICDLSGADIKEVALGMGLDKRIGNLFLNAGLGYGGSCFPKDVSAFIKIAELLGYNFQLLKAVEGVNASQLQYFHRKIEEAFWVLKGKKLAVWGLAFKPNTDDMRSAPSIEIITKLISEGTTLVAYDPQAAEKAKKYFPQGIHFADDIYEMLTGCEGLLIFTEWDIFVNADLEKVKARLTQPIIIDGRNIFDPQLMKEKGFEYISIGRPPVKNA
jgi:UDPglucose 6-dehydrogenase